MRFCNEIFRYGLDTLITYLLTLLQLIKINPSTEHNDVNIDCISDIFMVKCIKSKLNEKQFRYLTQLCDYPVLI